MKQPHEMAPEEGVAMMKQLFNPLRGYAVGYKGSSGRRGLCQVPAKEKDKVASKETWRAPRQGDLFTGWASVHRRDEKKRRG